MNDRYRRLHFSPVAVLGLLLCLVPKGRRLATRFLDRLLRGTLRGDEGALERRLRGGGFRRACLGGAGCDQKCQVVLRRRVGAAGVRCDFQRAYQSLVVASCHRISVIRKKPKSRNSREVTAYWMPITL